MRNIILQIKDPYRNRELKVILRHSNLATTQRYIAKINEQEALRWIESLYGLLQEAWRQGPPRGLLRPESHSLQQMRL